MKLQKLTLETSLYLLALGLAVALRFAALPAAALSDPEAGLALQAYDLVQGNAPVLGPHAIYTMPTALLMFLFGSSNFVAHFWPAAAGCLLLLIPILLREQLGRIPAILLAFFIALDPGLLAISRQVNSTGMTVACVLLALVFLFRKRAAWAGVFAGASLLGGPQLWPGVVGLGLTYWATSNWFPGFMKRDDAGAFPWRLSLGFAVGVFWGLGSLLMLAPSGMGAAAGSLPAYIQGWGQPSGVPLARMLAALLAYQAFGLALGIAGGIGGLRRKDPLDTALFTWWAVALLLSLIYPGRHFFDLAWSLPPLLALAARQVVRITIFAPEDGLPAAGQATLVVILGMFFIYSILSFPRSPEGATPDLTWAYIKLGAPVVLLLAVTFLIAWGWSWSATQKGLGWGLSAFLAIFTLSATFHAGGFSRYPDAELWKTGPDFQDAALLRQTITEFSQWKPKPEDSPKIWVSGLNSAALRWALHDFPNLRFEDALLKDAQPDLVITPAKTNLEMTTAYRGEEFVLSKGPAWGLIAPDEWMTWLIYRRLPKQGQEFRQVILWGRTDLFPGGTGQAAQNGDVSPQPTDQQPEIK